jgi:phenylalanyl-tRNA synthetase alpha chain
LTPKVKKVSLKAEYIPVLKKLHELGKSVEARDLVQQMNMGYEKVMSGAVYNLEQQGLAKYDEKEVIIIAPTEETKEYVKKGLPERQIYTLFRENDRREAFLNDFQKEVETSLGFGKKLFFIGISNMKRNKWVVSSKAMGKEQIFVYNETADEMETEKFLKLFQKNAQISETDIPKDLIKSKNILHKRKLFQLEKNIIRMVSLTELGKKTKISAINIIENEVLLIDSEMIKNGTWKENISNLKKYEVNALGPRINTGKYHPMTIIINEIREIFHSMGFEEIQGPVVETAFFNFDSLYQPQDHPARELHDTFYLSNPKTGKLPSKKYVENVKNTHENGGDSGSIGWKYNWSEDIAKKSLLRTHTTATTIRQLSRFADGKTKLPKKVFCIDRVFRNEKVDRTHLAEFQQIEGIVIGENVTLCDLIGQIVEFYKRMGFKKVVTRPGFFPYTEPSMEIAVYSEELGAWLEMGGSGIFRPEVTYPWGIKDPVRVLAWGMGLERLAMLKLKRKDIRDLYQSPISWLREVPY